MRPKSSPHSALLLLASVFIFTATAVACDHCAKPPAVSASSTDASKPAPRKFRLKGVVTDVLPDQSALMVKHEAIPGVMKAMTMLFVVTPEGMKSVKKGDAITAIMFRDDDTWRLEDIKVISPSP